MSAIGLREDTRCDECGGVNGHTSSCTKVKKWPWTNGGVKWLVK